MSSYYYLKGGYIWFGQGGTFDPIVGRVYGQDAPNSATYQLAGRPNDEVPVHGFNSRQEAFEAARAELEMRAAIDEAIA